MTHSRAGGAIALQARSKRCIGGGQGNSPVGCCPYGAGVKKKDPNQLQLALAPRLKVIAGLGQRAAEPLPSRDAVARVLMEAGADLLLRRISDERAGEIEHRVDEVLELFDRVDRHPLFRPVLQRKLDELEALMRETRDKRALRVRR
jgi:hypothetical protein